MFLISWSSNPSSPIGGLEHVGVAEQQRAAMPRTGDQADRRVQHVRARALRADERPRDVEPVLGEELIEVVAGDAAGDVRKAPSNHIRVSCGNVLQLGVDLAAPSAGVADPLQFLF
jgi:hypothetical protein